MPLTNLLFPAYIVWMSVKSDMPGEFERMHSRMKGRKFKEIGEGKEGEAKFAVPSSALGSLGRGKNILTLNRTDNGYRLSVQYVAHRKLVTILLSFVWLVVAFSAYVSKDWTNLIFIPIFAAASYLDYLSVFIVGSYKVRRFAKQLS